MSLHHEFKNLVFQGGGVAAIAYAGFIEKVTALKLLDLNKIERVAGVSSGAIAAMQLALNYSPQEMVETVKETDYRKFADTPKGFVADPLKFFSEEGGYQDEFLFNYIGDLIKAKTGDAEITFQDLQKMKISHRFKDLYVVATKLFMINGQPAAQSFTFSHEHTPLARVVDAIRASTSLPIVFPPIRLFEKENGEYIIQANGHVYVDGGMLDVFPIRIFDYPQYLEGNTDIDLTNNELVFNPWTLGLKLKHTVGLAMVRDVSDNVTEHAIQGRFQYAEALYYVLSKGQQESSFESSDDLRRTVLIDVDGIKSTAFDLDNTQKQALFEAGEFASSQMVALRAKVES